MPDIIKLLPDFVANQIAAGEVVQRPASVVKELIENAIDAKATHIQLILKDAGKTTIQLIDNGIGMSETDARLAFERHATSKISHANDLFNLTTKGFRGEALASIVAVSHLVLETNQTDTGVGTQIKYNGEEFVSQENAVLLKGTSVTVKNLFFNIPARRNFLKSDNVEQRHILNEIYRVALSHPAVSFSLVQQSKKIIDLPKQTLKKRIIDVFGHSLQEKLIELKEETLIINIKGFIAKPEFSKKNRNEQYFFVNNRYFKHPYFSHAVNKSFEGILKQGYFPTYFIYFDITPSAIDLNIHPNKTEVKFVNESEIYSILLSCLKYALGQFNASSSIDFNKNYNLELPYHYKNKKLQYPKIEVDKNYNPFKQVSDENVPIKSTWEDLYVDINNREVFDIKTQEVVKTKLFPNIKPVTTGKFKVFQVYKKYIVTQYISELVIIHKMRANQRIMYDNLMQKLTIDNNIQKLLHPIVIDISKPELNYFKDLHSKILKAGFSISFKGEKLIVNAMPSALIDFKVSDLFENLLTNFELNDELKFNVNIKELIVKNIAKKTALRLTTPLTEEASEKLIQNLFNCKTPKYSPFNKPIYHTLKVKDLNIFF